MEDKMDCSTGKKRYKNPNDAQSARLRSRFSARVYYSVVDGILPVK
jgi:hypothetical protein